MVEVQEPKTLVRLKMLVGKEVEVTLANSDPVYGTLDSFLVVDGNVTALTVWNDRNDWVLNFRYVISVRAKKP